MSGDIGRPSSSEVAHEAEDTRASLASTLEQLRTNLRPENVMDEVVANARVGAASIADNLAGVARQHPIPAVLLAAGSALVMRLFNRRGAAEPLAPVEGRVSEAGTRHFGPGIGRPPMLRNPSSFEPAPGRERFDTPIRAGDAMQRLSHDPAHGRSGVKSKLSTLLEEQPLILGAIGLAVGAAIGAALPITDTEENLLGPTAHRFREQATDAARHEVDGMRAAAGEAYDNVRRSAADSIRTVVDRAGESLSPESRDV